MTYKGFKVFVDTGVALIVFLVSLPLTLIITILLFVYNNGSPFFFQLRPGKGGRIFRLIKFRTMNDKRNQQGELLPDEKRLTVVGQIVRKLSLDEIPQLLNVIKGDMSLVGPRPLLTEYLSLYNEKQKRRHEIKPGITGWAQVNGRNAISWEKKFELDVWYVDNQSFWLDIKILFLTVKKVFAREGINADSSATMQKFKGS